MRAKSEVTTAEVTTSKGREAHAGVNVLLSLYNGIKDHEVKAIVLNGAMLLETIQEREKQLAAQQGAA